jgi:anti-sigma factor RsiW
MRHIPEDELHAYLDQALSRSQCVEIESHLARCPACQAERDAIAALRDRTTGLLALLTPGPRHAPAWTTLEARAIAARARSRRRVRYAGWAASVAAAVAMGWLARDFAPDPAGNVAVGEPAASAGTPATLSADASSVVVSTDVSAPIPSPAPRPAARLASAEPSVPTGADTAARPDGPVAAGMALRGADGVQSDFPLAGVWRTVTWDRLRGDSSDWVPRVDGLPVKEIRVSQRTGGGLSVVSQQLASGQTIRTVAGPASDVRSLISNRTGQSASAQLQVDPSMASKADGERMLVILGDIPTDSLRAMLLRVK